MSREGLLEGGFRPGRDYWVVDFVQGGIIEGGILSRGIIDKGIIR